MIFFFTNKYAMDRKKSKEIEFGHGKTQSWHLVTAGTQLLATHAGKAYSAKFLSYDCDASILICILLTLLGLEGTWQPHPHVDPTFIAVAVGLAAGAASAKAASFVWYVYPLTHGTADEPEHHLAQLLSA